MRKYVGVLLAFILVGLAFGGCGNEKKDDVDEKKGPVVTSPPPSDEPIQRVSILFVGNSLTKTGDMPKRVQMLAEPFGYEVEYLDISKDGANLADMKEQAIEEMKKAQYDYAVFQDYGSRPLDDKEGYMRDVEELCDMAKETGAEPVIYNPAWATTYEGLPDVYMQDVFTEIYEEAVEMNGATFVNAGDAWCYAYDEHPHISLYKSADYHPNDMGAYYTGCVFVSTLFDIQLSDVSETNPYYHMLYGDDAVLLGRAASEFASYYEANGKKPELGSYKAGD